ncbi:hypothetical protein HPB48_009558 [Haemaphysalis longicornis]|uniref:RNase H type-1 domain-containing protein n=1 Tax=Haemaphysalis longicornis TaxID=44386 RepID=A0A9J6G0I5_HAELO|nr:hypothetical protein HPB48_009558 [Haemaphysalis longicornis]
MAIHKQYHSNPEVCYVDTASYPGRSAVTAVVVDHQGNAVSSCSVNTSRTDTGEVAITLAIMGTRASVIIWDSKTAMRNYARGRVSTEAARILRTRSETTARQVRLVWTPAHSSLPGNEMAHEDSATRLTPSPKRCLLTRGEGIGSGHIRKLHSTIG